MLVAGRRAYALVVSTAAILLVLLLLLRLSLDSRSRGFVYPNPLPGGFRVASVKTGAEAVGEIIGLHENPGGFAGSIEDAAVVEYTGGVKLWLTYAGDSACILVDAMASKIAAYQERLSLTEPIAHNISGCKVYFSWSPGSNIMHVFWCREGVAVWASISMDALQTVDPRMLVQELVEGVYYKR